MLDASIRQQLEGYLANLQHSIDLTAYIDKSDKAMELLSVVKEVGALSDKVNVHESIENVARQPSMVISNPNNGSEIGFAGIPMGHEFSSFVLALLHSGGHPIKESDEIKQQIQALEGDYLFEIYISLSCQNCPEVVQALNTMAALNPRIKNRYDRWRPVSGRSQ